MIKMKNMIDMTPIGDLCKEYMDRVEEIGEHPEDDYYEWPQRFFETALETYYGEDIWNKIDKLSWNKPINDCIGTIKYIVGN